jgi:predicted ATPase
MMKFTRIRLENWRNFRNVNISLQDRSFIIGPNAAGKSNLLDAFRFLRDLAKDGLEKSVNNETRGGMTKIRDLWAREKNPVLIDCELVDAQNTKWQYLLEIMEAKQNGHSRPKIKQELVRKESLILVERPNAQDKSDPENLFQTHLEQVSTNKAFRDLNEALKNVRYLHLVPQLIREQARVKKIISDPYGSDFLEQILRTPAKNRRERLNEIERIIKIAVPYFDGIICEKDNMGMPHLKFKYKHWRPQGAWQFETELSDGTIRLIGLIWALLEGGGVLLLEEPELSLHPELVRRLPQLSARLQKHNPAQVIISTHSWQMLNDKGIASDEIILLIPSRKGTIVKIGADIKNIKSLMESGMSAAEAAFPETSPESIGQLDLFYLQ